MLIVLGKYAICVAYFLFFICLTKLIRDKFGAPDEVARKTTHMLASLAWFLFYVLFYKTVNFYLAPLVGIVVVLVGIKTNFLAMLRRGDSNADDQGIVFYVVTLFILAVFATYYPPALPACSYGMLSIGFGDGTAALVGRKWGKYTPKLRENKSLAGSLACFVFATIAMIVACLLMHFSLCIWKFMILALVATIAELFGDKYDNLIIGLSVAIVGVLLKV